MAFSNPSSMHRYFKAALARDITKERDDDGETNAALDEEMPMLLEANGTKDRRQAD